MLDLSRLSVSGGVLAIFRPNGVLPATRVARTPLRPVAHVACTTLRPVAHVAHVCGIKTRFSAGSERRLCLGGW